MSVKSLHVLHYFLEHICAIIESKDTLFFRGLFYVFAMPCGMWDLSSPPRDQTCTPCTESVESFPQDCQGCPLDAHVFEVQCKARPSQVVLVVKKPSTNARDTGDSGSIPGSGRSPRGGHGNPLQCSCLENPMDRGAWWATDQR